MAAITENVCWCSLALIFLFVMAALAFISERVHYSIKITVYYIIVMFVAALMIPIGLFRPLDVQNHQIAKWMFTFLFKLFGVSPKVTVKGLENVDSAEPMVIVANHQSSIDLITLMRIWPQRCTSLAKKELIFAGTFGIAAWLAGTVFIDRLNRERAMSTMENLVAKTKKKNLKLWIFPEGTRNGVINGMLPFKKGAFHLAIQAQIPIVSIVISSYETFYKRKQWFGSGEIIATCLPPVSTVGLTADNVDELVEKVRKQMLKVFEETSAEVKTAAVDANQNKKHE